MLEEIMNNLEELLVNDWNANIEQYSTVDLKLDLVDENNIKMFDFDLDRNRRNVMLFVLPENEFYERLDMSSQEVSTEITFYVICRNDTRPNLYKKVLRYTSSLFDFIKEHYSLNGFIGDMYINTSEYYHAIESNEDIKGAEIVVRLSYEK